MQISLYFSFKELIFTDDESVVADARIEVSASTPLSRAKVLNFFETANSLAVVSADPEASFQTFSREFRWVEAAGTLVRTPSDEVLMICRGGRWDLPKGRCEEGEEFDLTALRETEEECGVKAERVERLLCRTLHAYDTYGAWELKQTHWYEVRIANRCATAPQFEEGIEQVVWLPLAEARQRAGESYPTIRAVFDAL